MLPSTPSSTKLCMLPNIATQYGAYALHMFVMQHFVDTVVLTYSTCVAYILESHMFVLLL